VICIGVVAPLSGRGCALGREMAQAREADKWNFAPPDGESYAMLAAPLKPWLESRRADGFAVSHGGVARALMSLIAGVNPAAAENADIWQGRAILFEGGGLKWIGLGRATLNADLGDFAWVPAALPRRGNESLPVYSNWARNACGFAGASVLRRDPASGRASRVHLVSAECEKVSERAVVRATARRWI
jgi:hypothetical protein